MAKKKRATKATAITVTDSSGDDDDVAMIAPPPVLFSDDDDVVDDPSPPAAPPKRKGERKAVEGSTVTGPSPAVDPPADAPPRAEYLGAVFVTSRCPRCDSTERAGYFGTITTAYEGEFNGRRYTHVVRRRTRCLACGQHRLDRSYENRVARAAAMTDQE